MKTASKTYDVVVIGGGPGGIPAAIAAARNGASVLLVEKNGYLGGNMTIGLPLLAFLDKDGRKVIGGIANEFMDDMRAYKTPYGAAATDDMRCPMHNSITFYDHEIFKIVAFRKTQEAGVDILLHTDVNSVNVENGTLRSVWLRGKGWNIEVFAKIFIDATGDGDVGYLAGAAYAMGQKDTGTLQPPTLMFSVRDIDLNKTIEYVRKDPEQMKLCDTIEVGPGFDADFFASHPKHVIVGLRKLFMKLKDEGKLPIDRDTLKKGPDRLKLRGFRFDRHIIRNIAGIGFPSILSNMMVYIGFFLITMETEKFGTAVLNGQGIASNISNICYIVPSSFGSAVTTMVSMNAGAGQSERAKKACRSGCLVSAITALVLIAITVPLSKSLTVLFTRNEAVLTAANEALYLYTFSVVGFGVCMVELGAFVGLGRTWVTLFVGVLRIWALRYAFILVTEKFLGYHSVFWGNLFSNYAAALITTILVLRVKWVSVIKHEAGEPLAATEAGANAEELPGSH